MARRLLLALAFGAGVASAFGALAQTADPAPPPPAVAPPAPDCAAQATAKKLAGAALNSFMKKCERDAATSACDAAALEKKLSGAARASFTKKCVKDATAEPGALK